MLHNLKHYRVLHETVVLLTIVTADAPHVPADQRVRIERMPMGLSRIVASYGFMQTPHIDEVLAAASGQGLILRASDATFFLSREVVLPAKRPGIARWRARLFGFLSRNAQPATAFFGLPVNRVVELGMQVEV